MHYHITPWCLFQRVSSEPFCHFNFVFDECWPISYHRFIVASITIEDIILESIQTTTFVETDTNTLFVMLEMKASVNLKAFLKQHNVDLYISTK